MRSPGKRDTEGFRDGEGPGGCEMHESVGGL